MRRAKQFIKRLLRGPSAAPVPRVANKALWSIGIFTGPSPLELAPDATIPNPVMTRDMVTDVPAGFLADPFLFQSLGTWHLFFEVLNRRNRLGEIGLATSADLRSWAYQRIVLREPFHLSYPLVFEWMGEHYMVPETHKTRTIRLYKADPFPTQWTLVHTLISGRVFADATLFRHDDLWWMFTETSEALKHDTLRLYFASDLFGTWQEHPLSPIVENDPLTSRPAGSVVRTPEGLMRFAQHCAPRYGMSVNAFSITTLTPTAYEEHPVPGNPILSGSGIGWNMSRMHHVDAHAVAPARWIAAVDGATDVTTADLVGE